jgi:hypothetical protein
MGQFTNYTKNIFVIFTVWFPNTAVPKNVSHIVTCVAHCRCVILWRKMCCVASGIYPAFRGPMDDPFGDRRLVSHCVDAPQSSTFDSDASTHGVDNTSPVCSLSFHLALLQKTH